MDIYYNKINDPYDGDEEEYDDPSSHKCQNLTFSQYPISMNDLQGKQRQNTIVFIQPYVANNTLRYNIQCFLFSELKTFLNSSPPKFIYRNSNEFGYPTGADEDKPLISLPNATCIECNYFMLLRYSTYLLYDPKKLPTGSVFGVSTRHGDEEKVYRVKPIPREYLENPLLLYTDTVFEREQDFSPGNKPPYPVEIVYDTNMVIEREKGVIPAQENIFGENGSIIISVFDGKKSHVVFKEFIKYRMTEGYYDTKRLFYVAVDVDKEYKFGSLTMKVFETDDSFIISTRKNGVSFREHIMKDIIEAENNEVEVDEEGNIVNNVVNDIEVEHENVEWVDENGNVNEVVNEEPNDIDDRRFKTAIMNNDYETVSSILQEGIIFPNNKDNEAIKIASFHGFDKIVKMLLEYDGDGKPDPTIDDNEPLRTSIENGHDKVVDLLLKDGRIDPSFDDSYPIRIAILSNKDTILDLLLKDGRADPTSNNNFTIIFSSQSGYDKIVDLLLKDGRADPTFDDNKAIRMASFRNYDKVVDLLLKDGRVDPTAGNNFAIQMAITNGFDKVVDLLLKDGRADPTVDNDFAIQVANESGFNEVVRLLQEDGRSRL